MPLHSDKPADASTDPRWSAVDAAMRRYGYRGDALIEVLHAAQEAFGHLHPQVLRRVALALRLPLSKVFGVATFYHYFVLKPPARHQCVVCMGTACYIHGAAEKLAAVERDFAFLKARVREAYEGGAKSTTAGAKP